LLVGWQRISGNREILAALSRIEPEDEFEAPSEPASGQVIKFPSAGTM
jgi:hypothetical protein